MEIFKDIKGYEGFYQVSNLGTVRSIERKYIDSKGVQKRRSGKVLSPFKTRCGYLLVIVSKEGIAIKYSIHRLVAETFINKVDKRECVNHIDGNKQNNAVDNLEWCSHSENIKHAFRTGLKKPSMHRVGKKNEQNGKSVRIQQLTKDGLLIKEYPSISEAARQLNIRFGTSNIGSCANGKLSIAYGFKWQYAA
ncbi:MAG: NUMOD4 domain-containing protein [Bacteroidota bacterium]